MSALVLLRAGLTLGGLAWLTGALLGRATGRSTDALARVVIGVGAMSMVGLVLAEIGRFGIGTLAVGLTVVVAATALVARVVARRPAVDASARDVVPTPRGAGVLAGGAALLLFVACWPPFETFLAASDATMYTNAGVHLARTGALAVPETATAILGPAMARRVFPSVRFIGTGPYIRLPGGLLTDDLESGRAYPAFFPLLPVWTGLAAAAGEPALATVVAPAFAALALAAVTLFAAETLGIVAGFMTALLFGANFVLWWFGRFAMSETLACAFLWSGLLLLRRREPLVAGLLFGLACLARTETLVLLVAAGALWSAFERERARIDVVLFGMVPPLALALVTALMLPNHHLGYLTNELVARLMQIRPEVFWWWGTGRLARAGLMIGVGMATLAIGVLAARGLLARVVERPGVRPVLRLLAVISVLGLVTTHVMLGFETTAMRSLAWLATYCTWPALVLALLGLPIVWRSPSPAARLAVLLVVIAAVIFGANPRVNPFQPWAMRRFLPLVLPGIALSAAAFLALMASHRGVVVAAALVVVACIAGAEARFIVAARGQPYFEGAYADVAAVAARMPEDAIVVVDAQFADLQLQVPLWLSNGRETVMLPAAEGVWQEAMALLVGSGRPIYWVTNQFGSGPSLARFHSRLAGEARVVMHLPDAPLATPPSGGVDLLAPLRIFALLPGGAGS